MLRQDLAGQLQGVIEDGQDRTRQQPSLFGTHGGGG